MKIVAFGYKSRAGKDTAAKILVQMCRLHNINRVRKAAFADKLKAVCFELFGQYGLMPKEHYDLHPEARNVALPVISLTPVQVWVAVGDTLRRVVYEHMWMDVVFSLPSDVLIISDMRYPAEFEAIKIREGICVRLDREGTIEHDSDKYLDDRDDWDCIIDNNHGLEHLHEEIRFIFNTYIREGKKP